MKCILKRIIVGVVVVLLTSSAMARADIVLDWNATMLNTIGAQNPFAQARFAAITQTAVFEGRQRDYRRLRGVPRHDHSASRGVG